MAFLGLSVKNLGGEGLMGEGAVRLHIEDCYTENVNHAINTYSESTYVSIRRNYVSTAEIILACISLALRWASASARTFSVAPASFNAVADATVAANSCATTRSASSSRAATTSRSKEIRATSRRFIT